MKQAIVLLLTILALAGCHKKENDFNLPSQPNKMLVASFPHIDTVTLWHVISGQRTGAKATITSAGVIQIAGYNGSRGTFAGGTYKMNIKDTAWVRNSIDFPLYQYGPDSVVSKWNWLQIVGSTGWQRSYYLLCIDGGKMPDYSIVAGYFIDSI